MSTKFKSVACLEAWNLFLLTSISSNFNVFPLFFHFFTIQKINILAAWYSCGSFFLSCFCIYFLDIVFLLLFLLLKSFYTYYLHFTLTPLSLPIPVFKIIFSSFFFTTTVMISVNCFLQKLLSIKPIITHFYMNKKNHNKSLSTNS